MDALFNVIIIIAVIYLIIEQRLSPRIEITRERDVLLFYGRSKRKYIKLFKI